MERIEMEGWKDGRGRKVERVKGWVREEREIEGMERWG